MTLFRSAVVVLALLVLGTFVAAGAHLTVTGPIVQSFYVEVDHVLPPAAEADLYVDVHMYAGRGSGQLKATTRVGPYTVPADGPYHVGYDGSGRACPGDDLVTWLGGPFAVTAEAVHVICVQHGDADGRVVTIRVGDDVERRTVHRDGEFAASTIQDRR